VEGKAAVKQYGIISGPDYKQVTAFVNKALNEGWELVGGLALTVMPVGVIDQKLVIIYGQALVKEEQLIK
jgi:hypothetical protein